MAVGDGVVNTGGIELHLTDSTSTLTKLVGLKSCNRPSLTVEETQTSDQDSGGQHTYKPGMIDIGPLNAVIGYEPGSPTDLLILEHLASLDVRPFKLVVVEEDGSKQEVTGSLFLTGYVPDNGQLGSERTAQLNAKPAGQLSQAAAA